MKNGRIFVRFFGLFAIIITYLSGTSHSNEFDFFAVSDLATIFEDGYRCPPPESAIDIFGIRDEYLSAQCVVRARVHVNRLSVSAGPLMHETGEFSISSQSVLCQFVNGIPIEENTPNNIDSDVLRPAPAVFPDYLSEEKSIEISAGGYQAIWLTVKIPRDALAGRYSGTITVASDRVQASLPIYLTVYPLTMPARRHLSVTFWFDVDLKFHDITEPYSPRYFEILAEYAKNMAEHRQNIFRVPLNTIVTTMRDNGTLSFDFTLFDRFCELFWDTGAMDFIETGFVAGFGESEAGSRWNSTEIVLKDYEASEESTAKAVYLSGEEFLPRFLPVFEEHLRERGWLDKTLFHIADEPSAHNLLPWREASDFVHKYAPSLRRIDAIEITHAFGRLEVWVPKLNFLDVYFDLYKRAQREGNELWYYTTGIYQGGAYPNRIVDGPLIDTRIMHWLNYRFAITGYLHWGYNRWTGDPYKDPGMHRGDGWQVYPKKDGVINSLRWEQMRNGIQDYEYLWLLEDEISKRVSVEGEISALFNASQRGIEMATNVIRTMTDYSRDPYGLYRTKKQIIDEIMDLETPPLLIVQTNPPELTTVHDRSPVEVFGLTDPDTRITVNGKKLPVGSIGFFAEVFYLSLTSDTVVIEAENENGKKCVTRTFEVVY